MAEDDENSRLRKLSVTDFVKELKAAYDDEADGITDIPVDDLLWECLHRVQKAAEEVAEVSKLRKELGFQAERLDRWQQDYDRLADLYNDAECFIMDTRHFPFPRGVEVAQNPVGDDGEVYEEVFYEVDAESGMGVVRYGYQDLPLMPPTKWGWETITPRDDSTETAARAIYMDALLRQGITKKPKFTDITAT